MWLHSIHESYDYYDTLCADNIMFTHVTKYSSNYILSTERVVER